MFLPEVTVVDDKFCGLMAPTRDALMDGAQAMLSVVCEEFAAAGFIFVKENLF